jgi:predicted nucleotidyltransferase
MNHDYPDRELPEAFSVVQWIANRFVEFETVKAVVLAGSRGTGNSDPESDYDLYVYSEREIPVAFRRTLLGDKAEINNHFWEPGDEAIDPAVGVRLDIMYRSPSWIEDQIDRVLLRHEASIGYTTCFWFNVMHSKAMADRHGWYQRLQQRARAPYPDGLRRAIVAKNWPILRRNQSSYRHQIELALRRGDAFSVHHRVTALLASFFDIWFALERTPHPGEKRLLSYLPEEWSRRVSEVLGSPPATLMSAIEALLDPLDERLRLESLI